MSAITVLPERTHRTQQSRASHRKASRYAGAPRRTTVLAAVLVVAVLAVLVVRSIVGAVSTTYAVSATVSSVGDEVTAVVRLSAHRDVTAEFAGACFADADGKDVTFPVRSNVALSSTATQITTTGSLPAGSYSWYPCLRIEGVWISVAPGASLVVTADEVPQTSSTSAGDPALVGSAAGTDPGTSAALAPVGSTQDTAMPAGDLPGWKQIFADDFDVDLPEGQFPGKAYSDRWAGYDGFVNPTKTMQYATKDVVSVHDGVLDMRLRTEDGDAMGAGVVALINGDGTWGGSTYGRYSMRFHADAVTGWGAAFLLWSDENDWHDGEIDFAEGALTGNISAFNHELDDPTKNALALDDTGVFWEGWHTVTVDWTPDGVTFYLDGKTLGHSTLSPHSDLHLVLQTNTRSAIPPADATGHILVDWVTAYSLE